MRRMSFLTLARISAEFWFACGSFGANAGFWLGAILFGGHLGVAVINLLGALGSFIWLLSADKRSRRKIDAFYSEQIRA